jgi:hypothetical protein
MEEIIIKSLAFIMVFGGLMIVLKDVLAFDSSKKSKKR